VANQPLASRIARVQDLDPHVAVLDHLSLRLGRPEDRPDLFGRRIDFEGVAMVLHGGSCLFAGFRDL
jgi:hypothetical protein